MTQELPICPGTGRYCEPRDLYLSAQTNLEHAIERRQWWYDSPVGQVMALLGRAAGCGEIKMAAQLRQDKASLREVEGVLALAENCDGSTCLIVAAEDKAGLRQVRLNSSSMR